MNRVRTEAQIKSEKLRGSKNKLVTLRFKLNDYEKIKEIAKYFNIKPYTLMKQCITVRMKELQDEMDATQ